MRFAYSYKTPDGVRHEAEIDARGRDDAFAALRARGIRPIKVVEAAGQSGAAKRRFLAWAVPLAALAAAAIALWMFSVWKQVTSGRPGSPSAGRERHESGRFTTPAAKAAYEGIAAKAAEITRRHHERLGEIGVDLLANYALVENTPDPSFFTGRIRRGYQAMDDSRREARALFRTLYDVFPPECIHERAEAQRLYVETMDEIDLTEERLANDDKAFRLLDAHRGGWHVVRGRVEWDDPALAKEFEYLRRDVDPAALRWRKDFDATVSTPSPAP